MTEEREMNGLNRGGAHRPPRYDNEQKLTLKSLVVAHTLPWKSTMATPVSVFSAIILSQYASHPDMVMPYGLVVVSNQVLRVPSVHLPLALSSCGNACVGLADQLGSDAAHSTLLYLCSQFVICVSIRLLFMQASRLLGERKKPGIPYMNHRLLESRSATLNDHSWLVGHSALEEQAISMYPQATCVC